MGGSSQPTPGGMQLSYHTHLKILPKRFDRAALGINERNYIFVLSIF